MNCRSLLLALALSVVCLALAMPSYAQTTWYVDDDAPNDPGPGDPSVSDPLEDGSTDHPFDAIQEGVDAASNGDTVMVAPGTYFENVEITGDGITLQSEEGPELTILNGTQSGSCVWCRDKTDVVIDGFTTTNGSGTWDDFWNRLAGGGIYCRGSSIVIRNNIITGNTADGGKSSGGVAIYNYSTVLLTGNIISNNDPGGVSA